MSWRNPNQKTGQNAQPLGAPRRWGGADEAPVSPDSLKRDREDPSADGGERRRVKSTSCAWKADSIPRLAGVKKRRSRWGDEKPAMSGVTTAITATNVSQTDLDNYAAKVRLEEINRKLTSGDIVPPDRERSPSPPPIYDGQGRRTNTREVRYRKKLEEERAALVEKTIRSDPNFKPPAEYTAYRRNTKPQEKIYLPLKEFPEINFFGLLVGPRGNTLKGMERESGAKISIRGKGSVKEGKGRPGVDDAEEEEMHCVVVADDEAKVKHCIQLINKVIEVAASTPEEQNDHKRNQLRELAALNGTLRDDENQICQNCGKKGHRKYECPEERNWTAHITCHRCGQQGHLARDCTQAGGGFNRGGPPGVSGPPTGNGQFDSEYANLMAELGGGGGGAPGGPAPGGPGAGPRPQPGFGAPAAPVPGQQKIPPWRDPSVWLAPVGNRGPGLRMGGGPGFGGGYGGGPGPQNGWQQQQAAPPQQMQPPYGQPQAYGQQQQPQYGGYPQQQPQQPAAPAVPAAAAPGGQPDYSAQWAAYYAAQAQAQQQQAQPQAQAPAAAAPQQDYSKEWAE